MTIQLAIGNRMKFHRSCRKGTSFIEVMAGLVLVSILFVPMFGILSASGRIWSQFESGHGAAANRQMAMQEIDRRLRTAKQIDSFRADEIVYLDSANIKHRILRKQRLKQNGQLVFDLVREFATGAGQSEILAEDIGLLRISLIAQTPAAGELLEIRIDNIIDPKISSPRTHSSKLVWKRV